MEKYPYTKWIKGSETKPFQELISIRIDLELWEKISIQKIITAEKPEDVVDDNVLIVSSEILTSAEKDQIAAAINEFNEDHEYVKRNDIRINEVDPNITWCKNMLATFGALNIFKGKSIEGMNSLFISFDKILKRIDAGSVEMAYIELLIMPIDEQLFPQIEKDEFVKRFEIKLGKAKSELIKGILGL